MKITDTKTIELNLQDIKSALCEFFEIPQTSEITFVCCDTSPEDSPGYYRPEVNGLRISWKV